MKDDRAPVSYLSSTLKLGQNSDFDSCKILKKMNFLTILFDMLLMRRDSEMMERSSRSVKSIFHVCNETCFVHREERPTCGAMVDFLKGHMYNRN